METATSSDNISRETHEASENKTLDKSEEPIESKESIEQVDQTSVILKDQKVSATENGEPSVLRESSELDGNAASDARVRSEEKSATEQVSVKTVAESADNDEAKENGDSERSEKIQEDRKQKAEEPTSVPTERSIDDKDESASVVNAEETFTPERTDSPHKKSDYSSSSSPKASRSAKTRHSRPSTGRNARTRRSSKASTMKHLFERSEERLPHQRAIVAVIDSPEWDEDEAVEKEIRQALGEDMEQEDTEHEEDDEIGVMRVLPSTSEEETPSTTLGASTTSRTDFLPQVV